MKGSGYKISARWKLLLRSAVQRHWRHLRQISAQTPCNGNARIEREPHVSALKYKQAASRRPMIDPFG